MRTVPIHELQAGDPLPALPARALVVDGIFGSGLSRPVQGYWAELLGHLNQQPATRVAIDIPSGLFADRHTDGAAFHAHRTLSFEVPKLAFFMPENGDAVGEWEVRSIGLDANKLAEMETPWHCLTANEVAAWLRPRRKFDHKGTYGHALMLAGSKGMMGAAILATRAALRSGAGLVTARVPECGYEIMQAAAPEAMTLTDVERDFLLTLPDDMARYTAIGVGPGLARHRPTRALLGQLFEKSPSPLVVDADALNLMADDPALLDRLPPNSILTPHPGEFRRLAARLAGGPVERCDSILRAPGGASRPSPKRVVSVVPGPGMPGGEAVTPCVAWGWRSRPASPRPPGLRPRPIRIPVDFLFQLTYTVWVPATPMRTP